jgi:dihydropteroate synthase
VGLKRRLFVTGQLARESLQTTLEALAPPFDWRVEALRIKVAALMTTDYLRHTLPRPDAGVVYLPGLCQADTAALEKTFGARFEKGPADLRDLPAHFGAPVEAYRPDGPHDLEILAEINDVWRLEDAAILAAAERYRVAGADLIDLGCSPEHPVRDLGRIVRLLRDRGFRVSVDTFDEREALAGDAAGAEMVLSLDGRNLHLAGRLRNAVPVVIPDTGGGLPSLLRNIEGARRTGAKRVIADAVLDPIHFGFAESLGRFVEARRALPDVPLLMGVGNLTELTAADSAGVNAVLLGVMSEIGVQYALTTEVAAWARGSVRELDCGRRLMHHARARKLLPKGFDGRLVTTRDTRVTRPTEAELRALQARLTDRNFRIDTDGEAVYIFNSDRFLRTEDIRDVFPHLGVDDDASHAFYLGRELTKADIARRLGKKYIQGESLHWGYLSWAEAPGHGHASRPVRGRRTGARNPGARGQGSRGQKARGQGSRGPAARDHAARERGTR